MSDNKVINTRRLQIFSLMFFMQAEHQCVFDGVGFQGTEISYSFEQAVKMFNEFEEKYIDGYIFQKVKLQYSKKDKKIICLNNFVKFTPEFKENCERENLDPVDAMLHIMNNQRLR